MAKYRAKMRCFKLMEEQNVGKTAGSHCNAIWDNITCWPRTPAGTTAVLKCPEYMTQFNPHNNATRECLPDGTWKLKDENSTQNGWTNYTQCLQNNNGDIHLHIDKKHIARIKLMSEIGYGVSLVTLIIAASILLSSKRLHCKSNSLHLNMFFAFILRASVALIKDLLFVEGLGLEMDVARAKDGSLQFISDGPHWECKLLITLYQYIIGASLMWIFMEGLYLHMLVHRTLFTERNGIRMYVFIGWLSPLLYIIPWVILKIQLDDEQCWNRQSHDWMLWVTKGPMVIIIVINFIFFIDIVKVLCLRVKSNRNVKGNVQQLRKIAKFALILIPLFGVIYILTAAYPAGLNNTADIVYLYFEMFYNSFQGFLLAMLFCFRNEEVRKEIRLCWSRRAFGEAKTDAVFLSSMRHSSNVSRDTFSRSQRMINGSSMRNARVPLNPPLCWNSGIRRDFDGDSDAASSDNLVSKLSADRMT